MKARGPERRRSEKIALHSAKILSVSRGLRAVSSERCEHLRRPIPAVERHSMAEEWR